MIPKFIHYCWFGGKPIPQKYNKYIETWHKYMPDFEIKRWDESNFDVNCIPFSKEAYDMGKYAYVSDYARIRILYEEGGIYFDTDVEMIKPLYNILEKGGYMAFEKNIITPNDALNVNLGLGFAVESHNPILKDALDFYESHHYVNPKGYVEQITIVFIITEILKKHGLVYTGDPVKMEYGNLTIYPWQYFCPIEAFSNKIELSDRTYTIHHYDATWMSVMDKLKMRRIRLIERIKRMLKLIQ